MEQKTALQIIRIISLIGILFSGYLSYNELFGGGCRNTFIQCSSTFSLFSMPACVYGLVMYTLVFLITMFGLHSNKKGKEVKKNVS